MSRKIAIWPRPADLCPRRDEHTTFADDPEPSGYLSWFSWAERIGKTRIQVRHEPCGLFTIWVPKRSQAGLRAAKVEREQRRDDRRLSAAATGSGE